MKVYPKLLYFLTSFILIGCSPETQNSDASESSSPDTTHPSVVLSSDTVVKSEVEAIPSDYNLLAGNWVRTDGGYTISIKSVSSDGTLMVEYYNPNPIHVGKSSWETEGNNLFLMVELRDANYPGSKYTLQYFPAQDKLAGNYFQAVEGSNYEVVFDRKIN